MKVLIISKFNCQSFPLNEKAIEVSEEILNQIGKTKCFDVENNCVIDYDNSNDLKEQANQKRIAKIKCRLDQLNDDFIQYYLGATIENIEERKAEFISLHNELRGFLGKQPRIYK